MKCVRFSLLLLAGVSSGLLSKQRLWSKSTIRRKEASSSSEFDHGVRLNKVFRASYSRRQADQFILAGRVTINNEPAVAGQKVFIGDEIRLDGFVFSNWDQQVQRSSSDDSSDNLGQFQYYKYWKPCGIVCTTDRAIRYNIIDALDHDSGFESEKRDRVFPVGRLDKDTSGLILLTSHGTFVNAALRGQYKQPKRYRVHTARAISDATLRRLASGVVITTISQRDGKRAAPVTAATQPCSLIRRGSNEIEISIVEGRNRQIRKMLAAEGHEVVKLHRLSFASIELKPLQRPGEWCKLTRDELDLIEEILRQARSSKQ